MVLNGTCGAAVFPPTNVLVAQIFGERALPRVLGLLSVLTLPLTFAMSPAVGWIHDLIGNYSIIVLSLMIICALMAAQFFFIGRKLDRVDAVIGGAC
jgi:MFS family permease